jgi:hypothetical protein
VTPVRTCIPSVSNVLGQGIVRWTGDGRSLPTRERWVRHPTDGRWFDSILYFCCSKGAVPTGPSGLAGTGRALGLGIQYESRLAVSVYTVPLGRDGTSPNAAGSPTLTAPRALPGIRPQTGSTTRIVHLGSTHPSRRRNTPRSPIVDTYPSRATSLRPVRAVRHAGSTDPSTRPVCDVDLGDRPPGGAGRRP